MALRSAGSRSRLRTAGSLRGPRAPRAIYKIYAESFEDGAHLDRIVAEAQEIVNATLGAR
jgi:phosphoglucomutase